MLWEFTRHCSFVGMQRKREIPTTRETFEDKLFEDLMWSDPKVPDATQPLYIHPVHLPVTTPCCSHYCHHALLFTLLLPVLSHCNRRVTAPPPAFASTG